MTPEWNWPGSRWWRCDFHVHSPGSEYDFEGDGSVTGEQWVQAARGAGLDAVAVTDHCTGAFVGKVVEAAQQSPLVVLPGVELSVSPGVHLLALFDPDKDPACAAHLLAACGVPLEATGKREALTARGLEEVLGIAYELGAVCIAAHVEKADGLAHKLGQGQSLLRIAQDPRLAAIEVTDLAAPEIAYFRNARNQNGRVAPALPVVTFSDAHSLADIGRRFTWLKLTRPTVEGIRLALSDGIDSVVPSMQGPGNPNRHAACVLESIEVQAARYLGRPDPFVVRFNPWLNAIIGGRGTGKSSLLNFLRLALRRRDELKGSPREEFESFEKVYQGRDGKGLLTPTTRVTVVYRKHGARFRVNWDTAGSTPAIEEETPTGWTVSEGDVPSRFPIQIFSQKQAYELSQNPEHLLNLVDQTPEVDRGKWNQFWREEESRFLALRARAREVEASLSEEPKLRGALADLTRKQQVFEESGHAETLRAYQRRARQGRALDSWVQGLGDPASRLRALADELAPPDLPAGLFDSSDPTDAAALAEVRKAAELLVATATEARRLAESAGNALTDFRAGLSTSPWGAAREKARADFTCLVDELKKHGIGDPAEYGRVVQERQATEERLAAMESKRASLRGLNGQADECKDRLLRLRQELTALRRKFLEKSLAGNLHVRIRVLALGDRPRFETDFRGLLGSPVFEKDIYSPEEKSGLIWDLYQGADEPVELPEARLVEFREKLDRIGKGEAGSGLVRDNRFAAVVQKQKPEFFDRLEVLYPEDALEVAYSPKGDGGKFSPLGQGSPGQKTAAILAFILSHGDEPLVLDQPEDDLDNHLIYGLIVRQLREAKQRRQVVVVTHNANIVVNGDAEMVHVFEVRAGRTVVGAEGGLQEQAVRTEVCEVMEGGREAFEARYRRISGGTFGA